MIVEQSLRSQIGTTSQQCWRSEVGSYGTYEAKAKTVETMKGVRKGESQVGC